jgi:hypothetical protein
LDVYFTDRAEIFSSVTLFGWRGGSEDFKDTFVATDYPDVYTREVRKGILDVTALEGHRMVSFRGSSVLVEYGRQCDSLYWDSARIDCTGEDARMEVDFKKQFATVYIDIRKNPADMTNYRFRVDGGVCGFDLISGDPVEGAFRCVPEDLPGSALRTFRLPRQNGAALSLTVTYDDGDGHPSENSFDLGSHISSLGYDWNETDLKDIHLTVNVAGGRITVGVEPWQEGEDFGKIEM